MNSFVRDYFIALASMIAIAALACAALGYANPIVIVLVLAAALPFMDVVRWLGKRQDIFDPATIVGVFSPLFLIVGPITQLGREYWLSPVLPGADYLVLWSVLQLFGFIVYRTLLDLPPISTSRPRQQAPTWVPTPTFWIASLVVILMGVVVQASLYSQYGGLSGWVDTYTLRQRLNYRNFIAFEDIGVEVLLGETVKFLLPATIILALQRRPWLNGRTGFLAIVAISFVVALLFGGLRGSRGSVLYAVYFAIVLYHIRVRRLTHVELLAIAGAGTAFVVGYMFFKFGGLDGVAYLLGWSDRTPLASRFSIPLEYVLSRDVSRMDVQAYVLQRQMAEGAPVTYGRSLLFSFGVIVPDTLGLAMPPHFAYEKTLYLLGEGTFAGADARQVTTLFGGMAEFTIAFGIIGSALFFGCLALSIRGLRSLDALRHGPGMLLWPFVSLLGVQFLLRDSAALMLMYFKFAFPFLLVFLLSSALSLLPAFRKRRPLRR